MLSTETNCFSYVQVRGSVPCELCHFHSSDIVFILGLYTVFWEQQGLQTFGQKIQITRPQASQPAFERHFAQLTEEYGFVHAVNLLGTKENESTLTKAYDQSLKNAPHLFDNSVGITHFDFHHIVRMHGHEGVLPVLK